MAESSTALSVPATGSSLGFLENAITTFEGVQRLAEVMAKCGTMPVHLKNASDCFRIVVQAAKWRMDPFAVAECTSLVHGRMCYEGKLVAAVLQAMGAIEGRLTYDITGKGQDASIVVTGTPKGAKKPCSLSGTVKDWRTHGNGSPWDKQPETQLVYRGTRQWARLYAPEAILGVYTPDEAEEIRTVEATVVGTDLPVVEPARTASVGEALNKVASDNAEQRVAAANAADKAEDQPTKPQQPTTPHRGPAHPAQAAGILLWQALEKLEKGRGKKVLDRLAKLYAPADMPAAELAKYAPKDIPVAKLDGFGKDVAELQKLIAEPQRMEETIAEWERLAAQEGTSNV